MQKSSIREFGEFMLGMILFLATMGALSVAFYAILTLDGGRVKDPTAYWQKFCPAGFVLVDNRAMPNVCVKGVWAKGIAE